MEEGDVSTRREALKRGLVLIGSAVGVGAAGKALTAGGALSERPRVARPQTEQITLFGRQWHVTSNSLRPGELPDRGHRLLGQGELVDRPGGDKVGEFFATSYGIDSPGRAGPDGAATLELHTFNLAGGSIIGTGTARAGLDAEDTFAIVGGTGRFVGARGSYVARQQPQEFGGDGSAEFSFTVLTQEGFDGR
jgi:hypothetical protein